MQIFKKIFYHPIKRRIAKYYVYFLQKFCGLIVIGVTGSAGKTTTKEMLFSVLSLQGKTVASYANIDPVFNIPNTILKCSPTTRYLVLEMGIEYPGEMEFYLWLVRPDIAVWSNVFWTHTQFFGNRQGVAAEKAKLIAGLDSSALAILNKDDEYIQKYAVDTDARITWIAQFSKADFIASKAMITQDYKTSFIIKHKGKNFRIVIPVLGKHFVSLALAVFAVAHELKVSNTKIVKGLGKFSMQPHRMKVHNLTKDILLIDDTYNANPTAVREAITTVGEIASSRRKILVLGDMKELGSYEKKAHEEVINFAIESGFIIVGVGSLVKNSYAKLSKKSVKNLYIERSVQNAYHKLVSLMRPGDVILIKGSRSMKMDYIVDLLIKNNG